METTMTLLTNLLALFSQVSLVLDQRNLWTFAAMVALLLKGKRAHLYELGRALPWAGKEESRVHKLRRWLSNPHIKPEYFLPVFLRVLAPLLAQLSWITLIIDRTEWQRRGEHLNLFVCSVVYHSRSFPLYWMLLPTRGCSSLADQQALLDPVLNAFAAHPLLATIAKKVLADREFCSPKFAKWLTSRDIRFCLRVKKSYRVTRADIPSTPLSVFIAHCDKNTYYFFEQVKITASSRIQAHLFLYWREDCLEPLALMTDLTESAALPTIYQDRMFIETLNRDLKSGGYDLERGKLTDAKRLTTLLIPMAMAYMLTVIQGHLDDLRQAHTPLKKRRLSLFAKARQLFQEVCDRKPLAVVTRFFQQFFEFLVKLLSQGTLKNWTPVFLNFSKQQRALLQ
jgi:hypothetical protein